MTIIVGILCKDGIVIASDSQESDDYLKRLDVRKIYDSEFFAFTDAEVIAAGTGTSAHIHRVMELIREKAYAPHFLVPRNVADVAEDSIGELNQRYGGNFDVNIILGVHCNLTPKGTDEPSPIGLYYVQPPGIAGVAADYFAAGSGGPFASYLLHRLHDEKNNPTKSLDLTDAIYKAIWIIEETKKIQLHCGGDVQLAYLHKGKVRRKNRDELKAIIADLQEADERINDLQRQLLRCPEARTIRTTSKITTSLG